MEFWAEILFLDSYFNPLYIHTLGSNNQAWKKNYKKLDSFTPLYTQTLGTHYKSLHFLSPYIFWLSLSIKIPEGKGEEVKAQGVELFDAQPCSGEGSKQRSWSERIEHHPA